MTGLLGMIGSAIPGLEALGFAAASFATAADTATPANFWMPEGASVQAPEVDFVFDLINWINYVFFAGITFALVYFCVKYRQRGKNVEFSAGPTHNMPLELVWTIIPTLILIGLFFAGFVGYLDLVTPPKNTYDIKVTAQQWSWEFEYPNGAKSSEVLVVPQGKPVKLIMRSKDVLHALFIPDFRVKQDIVPGRYTYLWFQSNVANDPDDESDFRWLFCAEYCGKSHSDMNVHVRVLPDEAFVKWTTEQAQWLDVIAERDLYFMAGPKLYKRCATCHTLNGTDGTGPSWGDRNNLGDIWKRISDGTGSVKGGTKFVAGKTKLSDYIGVGLLYETPRDYVRESIYNPGALLVDGYGNQMPTFQGQLNDLAIDAIIGMMEHLEEFDSATGEFNDEARIAEAQERIEAAKQAAAQASNEAPPEDLEGQSE